MESLVCYVIVVHKFTASYTADAAFPKNKSERLQVEYGN